MCMRWHQTAPSSNPSSANDWVFVWASYIHFPSLCFLVFKKQLALPVKITVRTNNIVAVKSSHKLYSVVPT